MNSWSNETTRCVNRKEFSGCSGFRRWYLSIVLHFSMQYWNSSDSVTVFRYWSSVLEYLQLLFSISKRSIVNRRSNFDRKLILFTSIELLEERGFDEITRDREFTGMPMVPIATFSTLSARPFNFSTAI